MTDDIDIVEYLRLWASPDPDNQQVRDLHRAADEIERLRELAKALYEETKRCGSKHDVIATWNWEEYEMDFLDD